MNGIANKDLRFWGLLTAALLLVSTFFLSSIRAERQVYDALAIVDITSSMLVRDMTVDGRPATRLDAAKHALQDLLSDLPCQSRLGLGVFTERRSFVLFDPVEVCENFAPIEASIEALDWRMAWEGDSMVAKGIYHAIALAAPLNVNAIFLTEGQEAPPLPPGIGMPLFEGKPGDVAGLIVGVGSRSKSPLPKFDDEGHEKGFFREDEVPQENRTGPPPPDAESRPGYHPKWAPFGSGPPTGDEHLSSVRFEHLTAVAAATGLNYVELSAKPRLFEAIKAHARPRTTLVNIDLRPYAGFAVLAILALLFAWPKRTIALSGRAWRVPRLSTPQAFGVTQ